MKAVILNLLQKSPEGVKDIQLIQYLEKAGFNLDAGADNDVEKPSSDFSLFQKNFAIKNALYELQQELVAEGFYLEITPLKTILLPLTETGQQQVASSGEANLRDFYGDWKNCEDATEESVQALLQSFWQRFFREDQRPEAFEVLGLPLDVSEEEIKQRYRKLAAEYHPDRGGDAVRFMEIREAYEVLKNTFV